MLLFEYLEALGYSYVWRLDDDSFIHSPVGEDVFQMMSDQWFYYGYR